MNFIKIKSTFKLYVILFVKRALLLLATGIVAFIKSNSVVIKLLKKFQTPMANKPFLAVRTNIIDETNTTTSKMILFHFHVSCFFFCSLKLRE